MTATASTALYLFGAGFWTIAVIVGVIGFAKYRTVAKGEFRWEVDMRRAAADVKRRTMCALAWLFAAGTVFVSAARFI